MTQQIRFSTVYNSHGPTWLRGLAGLVVAIGIGWIAPRQLSSNPAMVLILILWGVALSTIVLSTRSQLVLFWALLPFVDLLKRLIFLDESAGTTQMYLVLATQDMFLLGILLKVFLRALRHPIKVHWLTVDVAVTLFGGYSLLSALLTPGVPLAARLATAGMRVWPMITYYLAARYLNNAVSLNRLVTLTVLLALVVALYGIQQFFFGLLPFEAAWFERATTSSNVAHLQYDISRGVFRTFGTMDSHNSYGIFLGIGLILTWAWRHRLGRFLWSVTSLILGFGLLLSFARLTWLMPLLAAGFVFLFSYSKIRPLFDLRNWRRASWLLLGIVCSVFVFYLILNSLYGRQLVRTSNPYLSRAFGTGTFEARLRVSDFLSGGKDVGLLGHGLAAHGFFARKFGFATSDVNYHNIFVDMLDSMGIVGLGLFLWFLYLMFKQSVANIESQTDRQTRRVLVALLGLVLAMLTVGHFNGAVFYFGRALPSYFWALCGILAHYNESRF